MAEVNVLARVTAPPLERLLTVKSLSSTLAPLFLRCGLAVFFSGEAKRSNCCTLLFVTFKWSRVADISRDGLGLC